MSPPGDRVAIRPDALNVAQMSLPIRTHRDVEQPVPRAFMSLGDRWINVGAYDHFLHPLAHPPKTDR